MSLNKYLGVTMATGAKALGVSNPAKIFGVARSVGSSYLINQNFETPTTGYDNGETWIESGTVNPALTSGAIVGSQSCTFGANYSSITSSFAAQSTLNLFLKAKPASPASWHGVGFDAEMVLIRDSGGATLASMIWNPDSITGKGQVALWANGSATGYSSVLVDLGVVWNISLTFVSGGACELAMSQGSTRPTSDGSGNVFLTKTGAVGSAAKVIVACGGGGGNVIFDRVQASASSVWNP
jgi:hypothetical protein